MSLSPAIAPALVLRVATWNIRAALGTDLRRDAGRVLAGIAALDADILALQEADHRLGPRPSALPRAAIAAATGLHVLPVALGDDSLGWHGNALLARPGWTLRDLDRLTLPGLEPRGALVADLEAPGRLATLRVVAVHLGLLRRSRRAQIDHIRAALEARPPLPTVILGDFNEWSRRRGLGRLARDWQIVAPGPTWPARLPLAPLDRLVHSPDIRLRRAEVAGGRHPYPSDHRPLVAEALLPAAA